MSYTDEIARLRAEIATLKAKRDEADAECREANASWCREAKECIDLNRELASMREQRDEARREACALRVLCTTTSKNCEQIAVDRGWDCFEKEVQP